MAEEQKSTLAEFKDAYKRLRGTLDRTEQKIEAKTGAVLRFGVTQMGAFAAGVTHEAAGKMDERYGMNICRIAGVNVSMAGGIAGLGAELLEAGGKHSDVLGSFGAGIEANFSSDGGRLFVRNFKRQRLEREEKEKAKAQAEAAAKLKAEAEAKAKAESAKAEPAKAAAAA
jgi:hypothetical protein